MELLLWEILVPRNFTDGSEIPLTYHQAWDGRVRSLANGLTVLKTVKGQWVSPEGDLFREPMIPVRVACTEEDMAHIADITALHYKQQAVMFYLVSQKIAVLYYNEDGKRVERIPQKPDLRMDPKSHTYDD